MILAIGEFDGAVLGRAPKELLFSPVRDLRFSADKTPYNPSFRAHIGPAGKLPIPVGYFLTLRPGGRSFLAGGLFAFMFQDATARIRERIAANGEEWEAILRDEAFSSHFCLKGEQLKRVPRGFDANHPQAEALKRKSWYVETRLPDEFLLGRDRAPRAAEIFRAMKPFNAFLNAALADFEMQKR